MMEYTKPPKINKTKYPSVSAMVVWKNKMFVLFLFGLVLIYIGNVQYTEYRLRKIQILEKDITKLKWNYWTIKADMLYEGMEEQVGKKVSGKEIIIKEQPPHILIQKEKRD
ncbi:MAG: hypothetical protein IPM34_12015 [Saprospiraceae bacterium]|nr:hypothetical protein [Saprospiraceae bacterium]